MSEHFGAPHFGSDHFASPQFGQQSEGGTTYANMAGRAEGRATTVATLAVNTVAVQSTGGAWHVPYRKGERKARGLAWERRDRDLEKELRDVYAELTGELREVAPVAEIKAAVVPHATPTTAALPPVGAIDFEALARDLAAVRALLAAHEDAQREQEEEEAVTLLLMAA